MEERGKGRGRKGRLLRPAPPHKILDPPLGVGVSNTSTTNSCCSISVCAQCFCVLLLLELTTQVAAGNFLLPFSIYEAF